MRKNPISDIQKRIADLAGMPRPALLALWIDVYRKPAPVKIRRELLVPLLAYKIQEDVYGALGTSTRSELRRIAKQLDQGNGTARATSPGRVKPGTRLLRQWHGESHEVIATETGYEYCGERYESLSQIARKITGTHWSGPAFFGLKRDSSDPHD